MWALNFKETKFLREASSGRDCTFSAGNDVGRNAWAGGVASPAAEAAVAAHLVGDGALALAEGRLAAVVGAEDVEAALAVADALRVEEHEGVVLGLEPPQRRALGALAQHERAGGREEERGGREGRGGRGGRAHSGREGEGEAGL